MKKSMIIVLVSAGALVGILYSLPKVIVSDKDKPTAGMQPTEIKRDTTTHSAENHTVALSPEQRSRINQLRNNYLTATTKEKKFTFADSLANAYLSVSKPDSAAYYWEEIAKAEPTTANLLKAGNGYYDAFGFAADMQKAGALGEKAREYYQKVLDSNPGVLEAKTKMAMTYVATPNPMQGIRLLREVIAEDPKNELALLNLGLLSMQSNQYDKAIARFQQVIGLNPDNMQAQFYLGVSYAETGKQDEARKVFELVKQKEPDPAIQASVDEYLQKLH